MFFFLAAWLHVRNQYFLKTSYFSITRFFLILDGFKVRNTVIIILKNIFYFKKILDLTSTHK